MSDETYTTYVNYVKNINLTRDLHNFKSAPEYTYMLEHVSDVYGQEYLNQIRAHTTLTEEDIVEFCRLNDSIGNPQKTRYNTMVVSPSSLRYIWQAHIILTYFKQFKDEFNFVEIGGGYGGLCFAISYLSKKYDIKINSYTIIDLLDITILQREYIGRHMLNFPVEFEDAATYGSNVAKNNMYLISNYCFSEISAEHQRKYIQVLFQKISHGFLAWNAIPVYSFGFKLEVCDEVPITHPNNKYVFF
jgi:hypothetical protein